MKKTLLALSLCLFVGCTAPKGSLGGLLQARETITTNHVPTPIVTHLAAIGPNLAGVTVTNLVTITNIETRTYYVTNTVWEPAPAVQGTLTAVNTFAPLAGPYAPFVTFGTTLASLLLGVIVKRKNDENQSLTGQLSAVVHGVEDASKVLPEGNQIKATIEKAAKTLNVADDLAKTVKTLTT